MTHDERDARAGWVLFHATLMFLITGFGMTLVGIVHGYSIQLALAVAVFVTLSDVLLFDRIEKHLQTLVDDTNPPREYEF